MNFTDPGANEIILIVLAVFAVLGFLKSLVKIFFTLIALGVGTVAGIWGYNNGYPIASNLVAEPQPWMSIAVGVVAFIGAFTIVRSLLSFITGRSSEGSQTKSLGFGIPGTIMGLLTGSGLLWAILSGVRYGGTLSELNHLKDFVNGKLEQNADTPWLARVKQWIDQSKIGQWHQKIDPLNKPEQAQIAKLAIAKASNDPGKAIVVDEDGIPFALPVNESLEDVIERGDFNQLLKKARELDVDVNKVLKMNIEKALGIE